MITGLNGYVKNFHDESIVLEVNHVYYEILIPVIYNQFFKDMVNSKSECYVYIHHYLQVSQSTAFPVLIGFLHEMHRDFFLELLKVNGIGPRTAVKMMSKPVEEIAALIDAGDKDALKKIPGISLQRASDMINKLGGKLKAYHGSETPLNANKGQPVEISDALSILQNLHYGRLEARQMIDEALERNKTIKTSEQLIAEVFKKGN